MKLTTDFSISEPMAYLVIFTIVFFFALGVASGHSASEKNQEIENILNQSCVEIEKYVNENDEHYKIRNKYIKYLKSLGELED